MARNPTPAVKTNAQNTPALKPKRLPGGLLGAGLIVALLVPTLVIGQSPSGSHELQPESFARQHETLFLDAMALREQAFGQGQFSLQAFGKNYTFALQPVMDMAPGAKIISADENGLPMELPVTVIIFEGPNADGTAWASLAMPGEWVQGEIFDGSETFYIEPKNPQGGIGLVETVLYRSSDLLPVRMLGEEGQEDVTPESLAPPEGSLASAGEPSISDPENQTAAGTDVQTITYQKPRINLPKPPRLPTEGCPFKPQVNVVVDHEYLQTYGTSTWPNQVRSIFNSVNNLYWQFCLKFEPTIMEYNALLTSYGFDRAWNDFKAMYPTPPAGIDFLSYFSGKDFAGNIMGVGEQAGRRTMEQQVGDDYHFGFGDAFGERLYVVKHELGHNHNAEHGQADTWWESNGFHRSIMYSPILGYIHDYFSYGSQCSCDNNNAMIRQHVSRYKV